MEDVARGTPKSTGARSSEEELEEEPLSESEGFPSLPPLYFISPLTSSFLKQWGQRGEKKNTQKNSQKRARTKHRWIMKPQRARGVNQGKILFFFFLI